MNPTISKRSAASIALLVVLSALAGGCGDDSTGPQPASQSNTVKVTITVKEADVIADCQATTSTQPGNFTFDLLFYTSDKSIPTKTYSGSFSGLDGEAVDIPDIVVTLDRVPPKNGHLYLEFRVTEWDNGVADSGMNDSRGLADLTWPTAPTGADTYGQSVSGSARCSVTFVYTVGATQG